MTNEEKFAEKKRRFKMDKRFENIIRHFADSHGLEYEIGEDRVKLNGDIFSREAALYYMFGFVDGEAYEAKKLTDTIKKLKDNSLKQNGGVK